MIITTRFDFMRLLKGPIGIFCGIVLIYIFYSKFQTHREMDQIRKRFQTCLSSKNCEPINAKILAHRAVGGYRQTHYQIHYQYTFGNQTYQRWSHEDRFFIENYPKGSQVAIFVNKAQPNEAATLLLLKGDDQSWLYGLFLFLAAIGVISGLKSVLKKDESVIKDHAS